MIKFHFSFRKILAACYRAAYSLHHALFLRPGRPLKNSKLIVIGSYRGGGAGKTPLALWLARELASSGKRVAVLCHEYAYDEVQMLRQELAASGGLTKDSDGGNRPTKDADSGMNTSGNCQTKKVRDGKETSGGSVQVLSTRNRYRTARELDDRGMPGDMNRRECDEFRRSMPDDTNRGAPDDINRGEPPDVIICDDGFEDSRLRPDLTILLEWGPAPRHIRDLIPAGDARSLEQNHRTDPAKTIRLNCLGPAADISFPIDSITNYLGEPATKQTSETQSATKQVADSPTMANLDGGAYPHHIPFVLLCGLAHPERVVQSVTALGLTFQETILRPDHDRDFAKQLAQAMTRHPQANFVITQKDAARLAPDILMDKRIFVTRQQVKMVPEKQALLLKSVL
ncbi:MAG: tetraacyldisaccharide 4'-kinase [Fibrobacter sp.]|nr:tetraacyldisaccharide 4'-kinase [Fibrobacter sp.]